MVSSNILLPMGDEVLYVNLSIPCLSAICDTPFAQTLRPCSVGTEMPISRIVVAVPKTTVVLLD
jgi:hypothetical protein